MAQVYRTDPSVESRAIAVEVGDGRHFLVIQFRLREWKTIVFQHMVSPDCWISRREIHGKMEPEAAVTGYVLSSVKIPHPLEILRSRLARAEAATFALRRKVIGASKAARIAPKRKGSGLAR